MIVFIHIANAFYVGSYLVKDILWLRVLTVVGGLVLLAYYAFMPMPLWAAFAWNILFLSINVAQIRTLLLERRPVRFETHEGRLYQLAFRSLTPHEFAKLLAIARWESVSDGDRIVRRGEALDRVMVIAEGRACVKVDGATVVELRGGCFVGEMSFITGERPNADVVAMGPVRIASWDRDELRSLLTQSAELRASWQMVISEDLLAKLRPREK